ncbi:MAG: glycosyltransferase [Endozoicomonas sp. (ex Botrylloides leachii)]|nr:glycosyltransferase [Endozoicomonas sp. (ex Botrylloides leachii)]
MKQTKVIYAHGVHSGGGLTLLKDVFAAAEGDATYHFILDTRCHQYATQYDLVNVDYFSPGLTGRLRSELTLKRSNHAFKRILSFNSLPFLISINIHTTVFFQNVNLISKPAHSTLVERLKRILFKRMATSVDQFVVQTRSVHDAVTRATRRPCRIGTLLDPFLLEHLCHSSTTSLMVSQTKRFVYVADGSPHKNHMRLLQAWELLHETFANLRIELLVTLPLNAGGRWEELTERFDVRRLSVVNIGVVSRDQIFEVYKTCDALVFPSLRESFGLPLLEATASNLDILASELDFVRDVVSPVEVFNPNSKISIARSIARYLALPWPESMNAVSAETLLREVFGD